MATKLEKVQKQMDEKNDTGTTGSLLKYVEYLMEHGPSTVTQLADGLGIVDKKAIRRKFQSAGLKRGGKSAIEVKVNGKAIIVTGSFASQKNQYGIAK